jgi:predicted ATPase/tetratricopeptide (TPR) repeat protein
VAGEVQMTVGPLGVPPGGSDVAQVLQYPAARLFVERARAVRAGWQPEPSDADALVRICAQLDGMPLALELAAARVASLSVQDLAARLTDRFGLLTTGPRTAEARQRTLRATVEWSHDLLDDSEQVAFRRLAVFQGGWTLSAAEAVVGDDVLDASDVLDVLTHLVNRSMVVCDTGHPTRYRMLETLRQYAAERLDAAGERDAVAGRHATCFRELGEQAEADLRGGGQREALRLLRAEQPNIRAALGWLTEHPERHEDGLTLAGSLGLFWHLGRHLEGRDVLGRLVAVPGGSDHARARALQAVSIVERPRACLVHPSSRCGETARESLELFQQVGDTRRAALSKVLLAVEDVAGTAPDRFEALLGEAEKQFAVEQDRWGHAVVAFVRLQNHLLRGQQEQARAIGRTAADAFRALDDPWGLSAVLFHLGWGLKEFGHYAESVPVLEEAVRVSADAGLFNTTQWALADLGLALLYLGERQQAADAFLRAETASEEIGDAAGRILARHGRGVMARIADQPAAARPDFEAAYAGLRVLGTPLFAGFSLAGAAWCDLREGRLDASRDGYRQVQQDADAISDGALKATGLEGLAQVEAAAGDLAAAGGLLSTARDLRAAVARPAPPHERRELERLEAALRS